MHPFIAASLATQWTAQRGGVSRGSGRPATRGTPEMTRDGELVIRRAAAEDAPALARLAALDSNAPAGRALAEAALDGGVLVAELDGSLTAALALDGGASAADPFRPSAPQLQLLALRAGQLEAATRRHRPRAGVLRPRTS